MSSRQGTKVRDTRNVSFQRKSGFHVEDSGDQVVIENVSGCSGGNDLTAVENDYSLRISRRLFEIVKHSNERSPTVDDEPAHVFEEVVLVIDIEMSGRFVQQQNLRLLDECLR